MTLAQHYVPDERIVQSVTSELILDLEPKKIEKVFHLLALDSYYGISYESVDRWYRQNKEEANERVQKKYLIK